MIKELHKQTKLFLARYNNRLAYIAYPIVFVCLYGIACAVKETIDRMEK